MGHVTTADIGTSPGLAAIQKAKQKKTRTQAAPLPPLRRLALRVKRVTPLHLHTPLQSILTYVDPRGHHAQLHDDADGYKGHAEYECDRFLGIHVITRRGCALHLAARSKGRRGGTCEM